MYFQAKEAMIEDVIQTATMMTEKQGYSPSSRRKDRSVYRMLSQFSQERYGGEYSIGVGEAFIQEVAQREPPLSAAFFRTYVTTVERLNHALENDTDWFPPLQPTMEYARSRFSKELLDYNEYLKNSGKTICDVRSRMHLVARFLNCADRHGLTKLQELGAQHIYAAFQEATDKGGFRKAVMSFLQYAYRYDLVGEDFSIVVPAVVRHTPVPSVYTTEEVEMLLASIDRTGQTGKRNYAIMIIAARLGLRSCDIAALKFDNIHFDQETIEIIQIKTKEPLTLPLLPEVRAALVDYIENERVACDIDVVFLNRPEQRGGSMPPHGIYTIVSRAFATAQIDSKGRKRGPHALRASLATALLDEGNGYPVIQKALGHVDPNAVQSYVKVEVDHLRFCALPVPTPCAEFARRLGKAVTA
jgi:site-specific recombinase XerD